MKKQVSFKQNGIRLPSMRQAIKFLLSNQLQTEHFATTILSFRDIF